MIENGVLKETDGGKMTKSVPIDDDAWDLGEAIDPLDDDGERLIPPRNGSSVAELRPVRRAPRLRELPDVFAALPRLDREDAETPDRTVEEGRRRSGLPPDDPWPELA